MFGEDPLRPHLRGLLANVRTTLSDVHRYLRLLEPDLGLPDPDQETLDARQIAYYEVPDNLR